MPLLLKESLPGGTSLGIWKLDESLETLQREVNLCAEEEVAYARRGSERKKKEFLASRKLLSHLLEQYVSILYRPDGKPYLPGQSIGISISHSEDLVVVVVSQNERVGVDVEKFPRRSLAKATGYYLSAREQEWMGQEPDLRGLHIIWSAKEAIYKYVGNPDLDLLNQVWIPKFDFSENAGEIEAVMPGEEVKLTYRFKNDYVLVVTS